VRVFNAAGKPIGHIDLPERCATSASAGRLPQPSVHGGEASRSTALYGQPQGVAGG